MRVINTLDAVFHELLDFLGCNRAAAATKYLDMARAQLAQPIDHVAKKFDMTALIGTYGNTVGILLDRGADDVIDAAIVPKVNDLYSLRLDKPSHDIDCGIMAVKQGCGRHEAQRDFFRFSRYAGKITGKRAHRLMSPGVKQQRPSALGQKLKENQ